MFGDPTRELLKGPERRLDPRLWHACAGGMVQLPPVDSKVYYFPQGHAEHSVTNVDFPARIPALVLCRVASVKLLADAETDEVFVEFALVPVRSNDDADGEYVDDAPDSSEKPASFAKTLTQSDANNGGGFSVPRYCAETIFPRLDYTADPPVQTILVRDVHGAVWKFRHIYRGTPRRHLLTTGWSIFVNQKKLVAGDTIVFLRTDNGELCVGIRRARRGIGVGDDSVFGWNSPSFSTFFKEEESKGTTGTNGNAGGFANARRRGRVKAESVVEAATLAASGRTFELVYYPRASTPEFCVKAASVREAMRIQIQWFPGMRFKMPFETEDSSRISWFMGTISSVQVADPLLWPNSPWRLLQVIWDEPDLLQNVKRVNPWLIELISTIPSISLSPFSPPRKKLRSPQPDFPISIQLPTPVHFPRNHALGPSSNAAGIQGARHLPFGNICLPNLHLSKLQSRTLDANFHRLDRPNQSSKVSTDLFISTPNTRNNVSCLLTIGTPSESLNKMSDGKTPHFVLFGQPILTEEQISLSNSGNCSSDGNHEKLTSMSDSFVSSTHRPSSEGLACYGDYKDTARPMKTGHCKVFIESEDVGRTLDLSVLGSFEELYDMLAAMFGVEKSEMTSRVLYRNGYGVIKRTGDEPFSEFLKTARRLTLFLDSGSSNTGRQKPETTLLFSANFS